MSTTNPPAPEPILTASLVQSLRSEFPALNVDREDGTGLTRPAAFFDGPAGTQVPQRVIDAIGLYLIKCNANHGGCFATSIESDRMLQAAHEAVADFLGTEDPDTVSFGPNMTTLTFGLSRALARTWNPGDEVLLTRLDHDANVTPWLLAAQDAGIRVHTANVRIDDCTLDLEDFKAKLSPRTRLVAVGYASNSSGSINPIQKIAAWAHQVGALVFVDAVHYAPHGRIQVSELGCDFLTCSAYKFFGPHIGIQWGRREVLENLTAYKVRPAPNELPDKWMTGTQNHEGLAGTWAAVDYLADVGRRALEEAGMEQDASSQLSRTAALDAAFQAIGNYERQLSARLLQRLAEFPEIRVWGITHPAQLDQRVPTFSITHNRIAPRALAQHLAGRGIFAWQGNYYALSLSEALGHEPAGMVRIGLVHYNTDQELERLDAALQELGPHVGIHGP